MGNILGAEDRKLIADCGTACCGSSTPENFQQKSPAVRSHPLSQLKPAFETSKLTKEKHAARHGVITINPNYLE